MTDYEKLLQSAYENGFIVLEYSQLGDKVKGLALEEGILLSEDLITEAERKCILAEEMAHLKLNNSVMIDLSNLNNASEELKARKLAVSIIVPFNRLVETVISLGYSATMHSVANELNVTEEFLEEAIGIYRSKYGPIRDYGAYIVYFNPFRVIEKQKV